MVKTMLLVPVADNAGEVFGPEDFRELESRLLALGGGFSRQANVAGAWAYEGRVIRDESRQYLVALQGWRDVAAWLDIVEWARIRFRQDAMYVEVAGIPEVLGPK